MTAIAAEQAAPPADIAALVTEQMARWHVPGVTAGVLHGDGRMETWGFGVINIETGYPVQPDTVMQIGSISKLFTATAIVQLVEGETINLDAPVAAALPGFRLGDTGAQAQVTLRHLLTHMSGIYGDKFKDFGPGDGSLARALAEFHDLRQWTPPGTTWAYCNTGFQAMGAMLEHHTGKTAEEAITARVITPLKLPLATFWPHEAITRSAAAGHNTFPGKDTEVARPYPLMRCMNAAGGVIGSVADLLCFARFHMGDGTVDGERVMAAETLRAMQQPQVEAGLADCWGLGWDWRDFGGVAVLGHGGSTNGFRARLSFVPERSVAVALLTNGSAGSALNRVVEAALLERYAGIRRAEPAMVAIPVETLAAYAGHYENPTTEVSVVVEGESLRFDPVSKSPLTGRTITLPPAHARAITPTRFVITDGELAGAWADFLGFEPGASQRFLRWGGRLCDRIDG